MCTHLQVGTSEAPQGILNIYLGLAKIAHNSSETHTLFVCKMDFRICISNSFELTSSDYQRR